MGRPSKYPEEFRREAVELYRSSDRPRCEVAESLGVSDGSLAAWVTSRRPSRNRSQSALASRREALDSVQLTTHCAALPRHVSCGHIAVECLPLSSPTIGPI